MVWVVVLYVLGLALYSACVYETDGDASLAAASGIIWPAIGLVAVLGYILVVNTLVRQWWINRGS